MSAIRILFPSRLREGLGEGLSAVNSCRHNAPSNPSRKREGSR